MRIGTFLLGIDNREEECTVHSSSSCYYKRHRQGGRLDSLQKKREEGSLSLSSQQEEWQQRYGVEGIRLYHTDPCLEEEGEEEEK